MENGSFVCLFIPRRRGSLENIVTANPAAELQGLSNKLRQSRGSLFFPLPLLSPHLLHHPLIMSLNLRPIVDGNRVLLLLQ